MVNIQEHNKAWELYSRNIIGTMLYNRRDIFEIIKFQRSLEASHLYKNSHYRYVWIMMEDIYKDSNLTMTPEIVSTRSGGTIPLAWLQELRESNSVHIREVLAAVEEVKRLSSISRKLDVLQTATGYAEDQALHCLSALELGA